MKPEIIPGILVHSSKEALEKIRLVQKCARWIQMDVLDKTLIKNTSWHDARVIKKWRLPLSIELHLMVNDPEKEIRTWRGVKNLRRVIWHIEAPTNHDELIRLCKSMGIATGLAISPHTPLTAIRPYLSKIKTVLIMGYEPGWSGQKLLPESRTRISQLKKLAPKIMIAFDGGITKRNLPGLLARGVSRACVTSAIFKKKNPERAFRELASLAF